MQEYKDQKDNLFKFLLNSDTMKKINKILPKNMFLVSVVQREKKIKKAKKKRKKTPIISEDDQKSFISKKSKQQVKQKSQDYLDWQRATKIVQILKQNSCSPPFMFPLDIHTEKLKSFVDIIKNPMDLSTVESKIKDQLYQQDADLKRDLDLIWENALSLNPPQTEEHQMAQIMKKEANRLLSLPIDEIKALKIKPYKDYSRKGKTFSNKPLTIQEQKILMGNIKKLSSDQLWGVWNILQSDTAKSNKESKIEVKLQILQPHKARELEKYVNTKLFTGQSRKKSIANPKNTKNNLQQVQKNVRQKQSTSLQKKQMPEVYSEEREENQLKCLSENSSYISDLDSQSNNQLFQINNCYGQKNKDRQRTQRTFKTFGSTR